MPTEPTRFCPLCERRMEAPICPDDHVPTVELSIISAGGGTVATGTIVASRYRVESLLGEGGMGAVYLATVVGIDRKVAIKLLLRHLLTDAKSLRRFYQEARTASALDHPNIVRVSEFGIDEASRLPYIAMEYLEGVTLKRLLKEGGPMPERRAAAVMAQVAKALVEAHAKGIVHRDLKPENIMVRALPDGDEHVKVLDFGIAKLLRSDSDNWVSLTSTGQAVGTPTYMSPEQVRGHPVDFRTDLYALGCILHQTLTGSPPYAAEERLAVLYQHISGPIPRLPSRLVDDVAPSADLALLHGTLLQKRKTERPASTAVVARILTALSAGQQPDVQSMLLQARTEAGLALPVTLSAGPGTGSPDAPGPTPAAGRALRTPSGAGGTPHPALVTTPRVHRTILDGAAERTLARTPARGPAPADDEPEPTELWIVAPHEVTRRRRLWLAAAGGSLVLAAAAGVALWLWPWTDAPVQADPAPIVVAPAPAIETPVPREHRVTVESDPKGAAVFRDGSPVGRTPFVVEVTGDETVEVKLRRPGYMDAVTQVGSATPERLRVFLVAATLPASPPPRPAPAPAPAPVPVKPRPSEPAIPVW